MNMKNLGFALSLTAAFGLIACGDSSNNVSSCNTPSCEVSSDDNLETEEPSNVSGGEKDDSGEQGGSVIDAETIPGDDPGDDPEDGGEDTPVVPSDESLFGKSCSTEGERKSEVVFGVDVPLICEDGFWITDDDAIDAMTVCNVEGATKDTTIAGRMITLTCEDGEWMMDDAAVEELTKCDTEGAKTVIMGYPMVCEEGQWNVDLNALMGGDDEDDIVDSSDVSDKDVSCKVTSDDNSVTMYVDFKGQSYIELHTINGESMITTITVSGFPQDEIDAECEERKDLYSEANVTCSGNSIVVTEPADGASLDQIKEQSEATCESLLSF